MRRTCLTSRDFPVIKSTRSKMKPSANLPVRSVHGDLSCEHRINNAAVAKRRGVLLGSAALALSAPIVHPESAEALVVLPCRLHNRYIFVRHGESVLETRGKIQSNPGNKYDITWSLTETGKEQMHAAAEYIAEVLDSSPRWIYTSNFQRAFQSAQILREDLFLLHSNFRTEFAGLLDPRKMGALEMKDVALWEDVWANDLLDDTSRPPPAVSSQEPTASTESCIDLYRRATETFSRLEGTYFGEDIVLVSHRDTLSTFMAAAKGTDLRTHHVDYPFELGQVRMLDLTARPQNGEYDAKDFRGSLAV